MTTPITINNIGYEYYTDGPGLYAAVTETFFTVQTDVTIPPFITVGDNNYSVVSILGGFRGNQFLRSINIQAPITEIGNNIFLDCVNMTSITIPNSVTSIDVNAFESCTSLTSIQLPNSLTSISNEVFIRCSSLASVIIPATVTTIGESAFGYCEALTTLTIPDAVTSIARFAFIESGLVTISLPNNPLFTIINESTFQECTSLSSIVIPNSVTTIGGHAFSHCEGLQTITLSNTLTVIGLSAFIHCAFGQVNIPASVTSILNGAFGSCTSMTHINLPDSITEIKDFTFASCESLETIKIPESVTKIGNQAFIFCKSLTTLAIPRGVTQLDMFAFKACDLLTTVTISETVTSIGNQVFADCPSLASVTFFGDTPITTFGTEVFIAAPQFILRCTNGANTTNIPRNITNATYVDFINLTEISISSQGNNVSLTLSESITASPNKTERESSFVQRIISNVVNASTKNIYVDNNTLKFLEDESNIPPEFSGQNIRVIIQHPGLSVTTPIYDLTDGTTYVIIGDGLSITINISDFVIVIQKINETTHIVDGVQYNTGDTLSIGQKRIKFGSVMVYNSDIDGNICFDGDMCVGTDQGIIKIKDICPNKNTIGRKKIVALVKVKYTGDQIYCIMKNALGKNIPDKNTFVSGDHGIYIDGVNGMTLVKDIRNKRIVKMNCNHKYLYNILMNDHSKMIVNNIVAETLHPDNNIAKLYLQ